MLKSMSKKELEPYAISGKLFEFKIERGSELARVYAIGDSILQAQEIVLNEYKRGGLLIADKIATVNDVFERLRDDVLPLIFM